MATVQVIKWHVVSAIESVSVSASASASALGFFIPAAAGVPGRRKVTTQFYMEKQERS